MSYIFKEENFYQAISAALQWGATKALFCPSHSNRGTILSKFLGLNTWAQKILTDCFQSMVWSNTHGWIDEWGLMSLSTMTHRQAEESMDTSKNYHYYSSCDICCTETQKGELPFWECSLYDTVVKVQKTEKENKEEDGERKKRLFKNRTIKKNLQDEKDYSKAKI